MSDSQQWQPTNPPTPPAQQQSWFARNKVLSVFLGILLVVVLCCCGGGALLMEEDTGSDSGSSSSTSEESATDADGTSSEPADSGTTGGSEESEATEEKSAAPKKETTQEPEDEGEDLSREEENAIAAAENYLDLMPFSKKGLIEQLSSDAGDGYPQDVAEKAVEHIESDVDWNEQAAKAAKNYQDLMPMSRSEMINQLSSDAGDGFTKEQAEHGADEVGL